MFRRFMLRLLILSLPVLPLVALSAANLGEKRAVDEIGDYLNEPLNSNGFTVKPDSAAIRMLKTGTGQVYFGFSTTYPFNDIGIALVVNREDSAYFWYDQIQDVDGAGGLGAYTLVVTLYSSTDAMETKFQFDVKTNTVEAVDARIMANLDVLVSSRLAPAVAGRTLAVNGIGYAGVDFDASSGLLGAGDLESNAFTAAKFADGFLTGAKIADGAITVAKAPNLDATVSSRLAPSGTLATVTNVTQLGGSAVGITGLNEAFDTDGSNAVAEITVLLAANGTQNDTRITSIINSLATSLTATDSVETWIEMMMYVAGSCAGCSTKYLPADGSGYKDGYEVYLAGTKKATITFYHNNNPAVLDARKTRKD